MVIVNDTKVIVGCHTKILKTSEKSFFKSRLQAYNWLKFEKYLITFKSLFIENLLACNLLIKTAH